MARIHVTTDDGEVIETWQDGSSDDIGHSQSQLNRVRLTQEILSAVEIARDKEGRKENGDWND